MCVSPYFGSFEQVQTHHLKSKSDKRDVVSDVVFIQTNPDVVGFQKQPARKQLKQELNIIGVKGVFQVVL